jgi:hypothetical protein
MKTRAAVVYEPGKPIEIEELELAGPPGDGAEVKVKGKTDGGRTVGNVTTKIFGNRLVDTFPIPANIAPDDFIYLEVKLPRLNLSGETNHIPTRPPIVVNQMQWSAPEARRGDVLTLTTDFQSTIPNDTEVLLVIFEYRAGGHHDPICKIPTTVQNNRIQLQWEFNYLQSTRNIPTEFDMRMVQGHYQAPSFFFLVIIDEIKVGIHQESGFLKFTKDTIMLRFPTIDGSPGANRNFKILLSDGSTQTGQLDSNGEVTIQDISPGRYWIEWL